MAGLAPASIALVLTSPPYPKIAMWDAIFEAQGATGYRAMHDLLQAVWAECHRVLVPGGFLCVNIGDATRTEDGTFRLWSNHAAIMEGCQALGFQSLPGIIWRKQTNAPNKFMGSGMLPAGAYITLEHEHILVFRKGSARTFSTAQKAIRRASAVFWEERNLWFSDLWDFKGIRQGLGSAKALAKGHTPGRERSGAFPFELAWRLIHMYSLQGEVVLDPFAGTGTTMAAAMAAGRSCVGYELDPGLLTLPGAQDLAAAARARLDRHLAFVAERESGAVGGGRDALKHRNGPHGCLVMTAQETDLAIPAVTGLHELSTPGTTPAAWTTPGHPRSRTWAADLAILPAHTAPAASPTHSQSTKLQPGLGGVAEDRTRGPGRA